MKGACSQAFAKIIQNRNNRWLEEVGVIQNFLSGIILPLQKGKQYNEIS